MPAISITAVAADAVLGTFTLPALSAVPVAAYMDLFVDTVRNTNANSNGITPAQVIQVKLGAGSYISGINAVDIWNISASSIITGPFIIHGSLNIVAAILSGGVLTFKWSQAKAAQSNLDVGALCFRIRLVY
jgi:hypothetical protein